ncbi:MAG: formylglycine-generating enzyme family protein [Nitrospirota bacterium]|nr:formylglycine-generating enzyme family protein [Nitrospirota bacterium]
MYSAPFRAGLHAGFPTPLRSLTSLIGALLLFSTSACKPGVESGHTLFFQNGTASSGAPPEMIKIPAGPFLMGSNKEDTEGRAQEFGSMKPWYLDEHPQQKVVLPGFLIDRTEVTVAAYALFLHATGSPLPNAWQGEGPDQRDRPVTGVNWFQADAYCTWLGKRLPTEAEWEKAARGTDGREFPWGNEFDPMRGNTGATRLGSVMPVGHFPEGASPYGVLDMVGNVWEWTGSWYLPYPGSDYRSDDFGEKYRVIRGGGWGGVGHYTLDHFYRTPYRFYIDPSIAFNDAGFRCAKNLN